MNRKVIPALLLVILFSLSLVSCKASASGTAGSPTDTANASAVSPSAEAFAIATPSDSGPQAPVITGSNANDIIGKLEQGGFPKIAQKEIAGAREYVNEMTDAQTGADLSCDIYSSPMNNAVISASFTILNTKEIQESDFIAAAKSFIVSFSSMAYASADETAVKAWIEDNIGAVKSAGISKTVGDAVLTLYANMNDKDSPPAIWIEIMKAGAEFTQ